MAIQMIALPLTDATTTPQSEAFTPAEDFVKPPTDTATPRRQYFKLADGKGWVPECSRRDRMRVVIAEEGAHRTVVDHSETQRTPRDSKHSQILTYTQT